MEKTTPKNESGMFALLTSIVKKSVELPDDVNMLAGSVKLLADEFKNLAKTVSLLTVTVYSHNTAINELFAAQEVILRHLKSSEADVDLPGMRREKSEKPN
jgi:hypothetical protein